MDSLGINSLANLSMVTWVLVTIMIILVGYFHGPSYSLQTVKNAPSILTSFGIFGTFLGIAFGLMQFDSADIESSVPTMIDGLGVAVWSSITGILGALSIRLRFAIQSIHNARAPTSKQETVADLNYSLSQLNDNLNQLRLEGAEQSSAMLLSNQSYREKMVAANTDALTSAVTTVMTEFNSRIEVQYGENFKEFNASLGKLLQWQQTYAGQLDDMLRVQESSLKVIDHASESYGAMIAHSKEFNAIASSLGELLSGLEKQTSNLEGYLSGLSSLVGQASEGLPALGSYVSELTEKLSSSIEKNNENLSEVLTKAAKDIALTVDEVTTSLARSVNQAHGGLAEHVEAMTNKTQAQMLLLDESMEKELTQALQTFGYQLTALSEKFVNDYMPLTDRLREVIALAEQQNKTEQVKTKQTKT
ncbi:MAG: ABC-type transporter Mla subunit MlaD [Pseudohongiellaceae bacterium]|jgi:ABC-type transporter Mla subunit MlaD